MVSQTTTLHYIHDPLCGWCYAAAPLVASARELLPVQAHGGGMMTGANRQKVTPQLREYVMAHDRRIAQASGQTFGEDYFEGLLRDPQAVFDSSPPITAMLAADTLGGKGLDLLARMQRAHYVEGRRIAEPDVLAELAAEIGMNKADFAAAFKALDGAATQTHIQQSRALLAKVGGNGFPTLALERDGQLERIDISAFIAEPDRWRTWLTGELRQSSEMAGTDSSLPFCSVDGC